MTPPCASLAAVALLFALLSGCSRDAGQQPHSSIFSHAEIIGTRGTGLGQFNKPRSLAVDNEDNLYVADMTGRVQKFSPTGAYLASWQMPQTDLGKPKGMARDRQGNIIVVEPHYSRLNHFAPDGRLLTQWGRHGTNVGDLALARAVAVNSSGEIFVSEYGATERIQRFSPDGGQCLGVIGKSGMRDGEFNRAEGLAIDSRDQVYVADSCNHRIQVFSSYGQHLRTYGRPGAGAGELSYPYDICVDAAGVQFVCEFGNSRIHVFDSAGRSIETIGGPGSGPGKFNNPWSVALDSHGNLYVADSGNHRVQKLVRKAR
jgi:DNA-binding beta-propeller fold protein YncE